MLANQRLLLHLLLCLYTKPSYVSALRTLSSRAAPRLWHDLVQAAGILSYLSSTLSCLEVIARTVEAILVSGLVEVTQDERIYKPSDKVSKMPLSSFLAFGTLLLNRHIYISNLCHLAEIEFIDLGTACVLVAALTVAVIPSSLQGQVS